MKEFPTTADEFYERRDDWSNQCTSGRDYQQVNCTVRIGPDAVNTFTGQVMVVTACNLLSRWCRRVQIEFPGNVPVHPELNLPGSILRDLISAQMRDADPFGSFIFSDETKPGAIELHIGSGLVHQNVPTVTIAAAGWLAIVGDAEACPSDNFEANPLGALAAACLGVAELFKMAVYRGRSEFHPFVFDVFTNRCVTSIEPAIPFPTVIEIGNLLLVGAGSVASSFAYCFRLLNPWCDMTVVDHDYVKVENFNRSPIFDKSNCGLPKANTIAEFLRDSRVLVTARPCDWDEFIRTFPGSAHNHDIWLPLANEKNVRWQMQNNYPPLMLHASTSMNWAVNFGRHTPFHDDCLVDRYPVETAQPKCSTGKVQTPTGNADAALPFLSMFAGVLIAADLARLALPGYPQIPNFAQFGFSDQFTAIEFSRQPAGTCICQRQYPGIWQEHNGLSKYALLSGIQ